MKLTGLHLLLTYQCTFECDHCFVWGSPWQNGVMTLDAIERILQQVKITGNVDSIYFEGGEPFLYYGTLHKGVQMATGMGFQVGIVSNAYWATSYADALETLKPFSGLLVDLTVSSDLFHYSEKVSCQSQNATRASEALGIPVGTICVAQPEETGATQTQGQLPPGEGGVMYRGRAAEVLSPRASLHPWQQFTQ
jgi:MoaA/NifB/PqqE/SkfB family radical SAM enzyme